MRLIELEKWGISPRIIEQWRARQGDILLPIQSKAVRKGLLSEPSLKACEGDSTCMLVSAPTSSGKSFCAELAAARALAVREKAVMLFPLKSLAEQKYDLLVQTYGVLGVRCVVATGDHPENDHRFLDGDYQIAVAIYEKFDRLLTASLDALKNIGLIVVDEIQSIRDRGRGALLERILTKIKASDYQPRLVGLSAVIGDDTGSAGDLAQWLNAVLVEEGNRPVELRRGVAAEGSFRYRLFNNGQEGSEPFAGRDQGEDAFDSFVRQLKDSQGSALVFLKSRMETVEAAFKMAAAVNWPEATCALSELEGEEPSFLIRSLKQALSRGVAFHNSDLTPHQRKTIEQAFINKEVRVIFSTTTLSMGINLPADTVYLETVKYASGKYDQRPSLVPVSRSEYDNMSGRAGRLGFNDGVNDPARAIILAENEFDGEILWQTYIASQNSEPLISSFESMPLEDWLLDMIASGLITSSIEPDIEAVYRHTFHHYSSRNGSGPDFEAALQRLVHENLVASDHLTGEARPTFLGVRVARSGLSVKQAVFYRNRLCQEYPQGPAGWVAFALNGPGWDMPPAMLSRREQSQGIPLKLLYRHFDHLLDSTAFLLGRNDLQRPLTYRQMASLKALLLLDCWRTLTPLQGLEERFNMHLGQITSLGETIAHLLAAVAELIEPVAGSVELKNQIRLCAFSIRYGLPPELKPLHDYFGRILSRHDFGSFNDAGMNTVYHLCEAGWDKISMLIQGKHKLIKLNQKIQQLKKEFEMYPKSSVVERSHDVLVSSALTGLESIEIDGAFDKERYLVKINGFPVHLTGKSFKYFTKLAWSRVHRDSGWIYKEDIEVGFNQARYLYRMKGEIKSGLNTSWPVIENNRLGYYRLKAEPGKIRINIENLRQHPDYEVRSLVYNESSEPVN